jgi:hypothetical protein
VVVTGYDDRQGCGYVLNTGPDAVQPTPGSHVVSHEGVLVRCTPELAVALRDALARRPVTRLARTGPEVPLTLDDPTVLAWLNQTIGGVLTVSNGPGPRIAG